MSKCKEGWASVSVRGESRLTFRKAHYFRRAASLCGRFDYVGLPTFFESEQVLGSRPKKGDGTCIECWLARAKEEQAERDKARIKNEQV